MRMIDRMNYFVHIDKFQYMCEDANKIYIRNVIFKKDILERFDTYVIQNENRVTFFSGFKINNNDIFDHFNEAIRSHETLWLIDKVNNAIVFKFEIVENVFVEIMCNNNLHFALCSEIDCERDFKSMTFFDSGYVRFRINDKEKQIAKKKNNNGNNNNKNKRAKMQIL
jgi:hypothetical protein